jgi:uncharacterized membrane protein SirB2
LSPGAASHFLVLDSCRTMSGYLIAKHVHQAIVAITLLLLLVRGAWMFSGSRALSRRWVKVVPHVNDTVLLAAALYMTSAIGLHSWIVAKICGLLIYIALGTIALKRGRTWRARTLAFAAALLAFAYVAAVAFTKQVVPRPADPRTRDIPVMLSARADEEARVEGVTAGLTTS